MRWLLLVLIFSTAGCEEVVVREKVRDDSGNHRLLHKVKETQKLSGEVTGNFHMLVWQNLEDDQWGNRQTITAEEFDARSPHRRWVTDVHSFDPDTGTAIIRVAEGDAPPNTSSIRYVRSWRQWDLERNDEIEVLQDDVDVFEPFDGAID